MCYLKHTAIHCQASTPWCTLAWFDITEMELSWIRNPLVSCRLLLGECDNINQLSEWSLQFKTTTSAQICSLIEQRSYQTERASKGSFVWGLFFAYLFVRCKFVRFKLSYPNSHRCSFDGVVTCLDFDERFGSNLILWLDFSFFQPFFSHGFYICTAEY